MNGKLFYFSIKKTNINDNKLYKLQSGLVQDNFFLQQFRWRKNVVRGNN